MDWELRCCLDGKTSRVYTWKRVDIFAHNFSYAKIKRKKILIPMLKKVLQFALMICGGLLGFGVYRAVLELLQLLNATAFLEDQPWIRWLIMAFFVLLGAAIALGNSDGIFKATEKLVKKSEEALSKIAASDLLPGTVGLTIGLVIAYLLSGVYAVFNTYLNLVLSIVTYVFFGMLGIRVATNRGVDALKTVVNEKGLKEVFTKSQGKKNPGSVPKVLDTSVIIDGRVSEILSTGFLEGPIVIPEFVLSELQHIADSSDALKRARGRRGLDVLHAIQETYGIDIYNTEKEKGLAEIPEVDLKLLKLAQMINGKVVTNDYNLNKVATIKGVSVLNINELANTLKPVVLPGETMNVLVVKEGKEKSQGIGYLDDGTMIVVETGRHFIGQTVKATVTSVLQTSAGRMIFVKPLE